MIDLLIIFVVIFVPLIMGGLLSAAETSITALSLAKLHKLKSEGNKRANIIFNLREDKETLISTILLANNVFNILASSLTTAIFINIFGADGVIYATVLMTVLIIIFAEIFPKTYAIAYPESVALSLAHFLKIAVAIFKPITKAINALVDNSMKYLARRRKEKIHFSSKEEIKGTIELHHKQGLVDNHDKYMFDGIFFLREANVGRVMTHRKNVKSINIEQSNAQILKMIKEIGHTRIPFWIDNPENIIGILNTKQLLFQLTNDNEIEKINFKTLLSKPVFVHENTTLDKQLSEFKNHKNKISIVVDEYGDIKGIITLADILEEVVGQVDDEYSSLEEKVKLLDDYYLVQGEVNVRDLNRLNQWELPYNEASTIAGLVIHHLEKIPEVGENFYVDNYKFEVVGLNNNRITSVKIKRIPDEEEMIV